MKTLIIKTGFFFLFLFMMGAGCEKDEDYNHTSIMGKWQLIHCPEGCISFGNIMLEITSDSVLSRYVDGKLDFTSTTIIKSGSMGYDTIFFQNHEATYEFELLALLGSDTLHLIPPILTFTATCDFYKRKK